MLPDCFALDIPEGLHSKGREDKQDFEPSELVYRRFRDKIIADNWRDKIGIIADIYSLSNDSYVRQKYSLTETDVLYNTEADGKDFTRWGVMSLLVSDFATIQQQKLETDDNKDHALRLEVRHISHPCMYPHSELHIYDNDVLVPGQPPRQIRTFIRREIIKLCNLVKNAE